MEAFGGGGGGGGEETLTIELDWKVDTHKERGKNRENQKMNRGKKSDK